MKKIEQYLPAFFALVAFLMLLIIAAVDGGPAEAAPSENETTAKVQTDATEPTVPETLAQDALTRVEQALGKYPLDETAMAFCVYDDKLHTGDSTTGLGRDANAHALASLCDEQRMNPVAAFWLLEDQGLYTYAPDSRESISVPAFTLALKARKEYPFTAEGTRELLTDILTLSGTAEDGMQLDTKLLGGNGRVDMDQISHETGDCYYGYFVYYGDRSAHFLCFYTRGGELIDELEFQLLNLRYAQGGEEELTRIDQLADRQGATLMAAAEQLLSGSSRADEGRIARAYSVDGYDVTIDRFRITGTGETGTLTNYSICREG